MRNDCFGWSVSGAADELAHAHDIGEDVADFGRHLAGTSLDALQRLP